MFIKCKTARSLPKRRIGLTPMFLQLSTSHITPWWGSLFKGRGQASWVSYATSPCICFWHQMGTKKHETEDVWWTHMTSSVYSHHDFQEESCASCASFLITYFALRFDSPCTCFIHCSYPGKFVNILSLALVTSL